MLAEFLHFPDTPAEAIWHDVMPGVQVCRFTMHKTNIGLPLNLSIQLSPLHFEIFFCQGGALMLGRSRGGPLTIGSQELLLLSDSSALRSAQITAPISGLLVSVDGLNAAESLRTLCALLGNLKIYTTQIREVMAEQGGCALLRGTPWNRSVFAALDSLPAEEHSHYCVLKTVELLYLLCTRSSLLESGVDTDCPDSYLTRTVTEMQAYMEKRLDEKLTIDVMSRQFHISPTAFKRCFRKLYGQPVHSWLLGQRMRKAAEFLYTTPMSILQIAQAVGYEGVSQFNVAFKRQYGVTPKQYRKMSETVNL